MAKIARIKPSTNEFMIAGEVSERLPAVTNGLVAYYPFDGNTRMYHQNLVRNSNLETNGTVAVDFYLDVDVFKNLEGKTITVSWDGIDNYDGTHVIDAYFRRTDAEGGAVGDMTTPVVLTNVYQRFSAVMTVPQFGIITSLCFRIRGNTSVQGGSANTGTYTIKNLKIEVGNQATVWCPHIEEIDTTITNTNTTLTNNGVAVEEAIINIISNPTNPSTWSSNMDTNYGFISQAIIDTNFEFKGLRKTIIGNDYRGTLIYIGWTNPSDMTKTYTFSIYARCIDGNGSIHLNWQGADSEGKRVDISQVFSLTKDWERYFLTDTPSLRNFVTLEQPMKVYTFSQSATIPATIEIVMPQMEQNAYPTSFVNGSRISYGQLDIPSSVLNTDEWSITFAADIPFVRPDDWRMFFSSWTYFYLGIQPNNSTIAFSWIDGTQKSCYFGMGTFGEHKFAITYNYSTSNVKLYMDGTLFANHSSCVLAPSNLLPMIQFGRLGAAYLADGIRQKDYAFYNRELSQTEISQIANQKLQFKSNGNIVVPKIIEGTLADPLQMRINNKEITLKGNLIENVTLN